MLFKAYWKEQGKKLTKLFNNYIDKTIFQQYIGYQNQLLSYIIQTDNIDKAKQLRFKFTSKQQDTFDQLIDTIDQVVKFLGKKEGENVKVYYKLKKHI